MKRNLSPKSLNDAVRGAVNLAVEGAVRGPVYGALNLAVWGAVREAVNWSVWGAVREADTRAPKHPNLETFAEKIRQARGVE